MARFVARSAFALLVICHLFPAVSSAQSPLNKLALFKHLEADANKTYTINEQNGPWFVLCSTFVGDDAERQANELVLELRREFKLPAYVHEMTWDFTGKVNGRGLDKYGRPKTMEYATGEKRQELAVLVGDFPSLDDPEAKKTLEKVRYLRPQCLDPEYITKTGQKNARAFAGWRTAAVQFFSNDESGKRRGPMGKAFMANNPLIPDEYYQRKGLNPMVVRMNEPVQHSLLKCPGRYSVQVATFGGANVSIPKEVEAIEKGEKQLKSRLEKAAMQAHLLTEALRSKGYEAYEFHDEGASIVTIGSFDSVGTPRADGKIEINPEVHKIMQTFGGSQTAGAGGKPGYVQQNVVGIPLDVQPLPIEVPKQTISSAYNEPRLGLR
ncbi:MAG: hypothetical protein QM775_21685 [Pirellulales bacterium]